eukprot:s1946_g12.t1
MINIPDDSQDVLNVADLNVKLIDANDNAVLLDTIITDEISDEEMDLEVDVDDDMVDQCVFHAVEKGKIFDRKLKSWEVHVDQGNLGKYLSKHYPDVEVKQFSPSQWNFERTTEAQNNVPYYKICENLGEDTHLGFYESVHNDCKVIHADCTLEQPADAMSWKTETLQRMKGYFETVLGRCRTGLKATPDDTRCVRKPTMFRSSSRKVCEAVNLRCQCTIGHTQMMGKGPTLKMMQNYEPDLVRRLGDAIYRSLDEIWRRRGRAELMVMDMVEKSNEEMQYLEQNKELVKIGGIEVLKSVALLH